MAFHVVVLGSLGNALRNLYRFDRDPSYIHEFQKSYHEVRTLLPHDHEDRTRWLIFLSVSLLDLFDATENVEFLLESIHHAQIAWELYISAK